MQKFIYLCVFCKLLLFSTTTSAQLIVPFTQRPSAATPEQQIYKIRGDFQMIGNTNLTLQNYSDNGSNNNFMAYVDEDNDSSTWNASMAQLILPLENNADPKCSNIIYAGLYWTARAHINDIESPIVFEATNESGETKTFDKREIKIKGPLSNDYSTITASENDIYYPVNVHGKMYSAYAEITDYVKQQGVGNYWVADLAVLQGQSDPTGLYGGWSMIVVYENPQMNWRDITIFDGHSYVAGSITADFEIPIQGFETSLSGPIDLKLGVITGEGDRNIAGDYLEIRNHEDTEWIRLVHDNNSINNFFNSSIFVGNSNRQPNLLNNTGLDISMFQIPNPNNSVITNNQTSTRFRYGTTQDTFIICNLTMSVNTYVSETQEVANVIAINGQPAPPINEITINPGDEISYQINLYNTGNEVINDYKLQANIPPYTELIEESIQANIFFNQNPTPNSIEIDPEIGENGAIVWDYGQLFFPNNPEDVIATLSFRVKVKSGCFILPNANCLDQIVLSGNSSGVGDVSQLSINNQSLVIGFDSSNNCLTSAIYGQLILPINPDLNLLECSDSVSLCEENSIDLLTLLPIDWLTTGSFFDPLNTGNLNGSLFNTSNLPPNIYVINYDIFDSDNCGERFMIFINILVNTPVISAITQPTCEIPTGSVLLSGLPPTGQWTVTILPSGQTIIGTGTSFEISDLETGNYTFTVISEEGCLSESSIEIEIQSPPTTPSAPLIGEIIQPSCTQSTGTVSLSGLPTGNWTITVLPSGQTISGAGSTSAFGGLLAGTYTFKVTNDENCTSLPSIEVVINPQPEIPAPIISNVEHPNCDINVGSIALNGLPENGTWTITIFPSGQTLIGNGSTVTISDLLSGTYTFTVTDENGCLSLSSIQTVINPQPLTPERPIINIIEENCRMPSEAFIVNYDAALNYIFNSSGPSVLSSGQIINTNVGINYTIIATNGICSSEATLPQVLLSVFQLLDLEFFNYLSPNSDNKNDSFNIKNYDSFCYQTNILQIFNRWGGLVFEKENYLHDSVRFDGFTNVKNTISQKDNLPEGTYFYIFRYQMLDNEWRENNGWLYLNRP